MLHLPLLLISGLSAYAGAKVFQKIHRNSERIDQKYQQFIQTTIDPLIGQERERHLKVFSSNNQLSAQTEAEKRINREVGIASTNFALALACQLIYPPLLIMTVPAILYFGITCFKDGYRAIFQERRVTVAVLDAILISWSVLARYWFAAALSIFLVRVSLKILSKVKDSSRKNMIDVFSLRPQFVYLWIDGVEVQTSIHDLREGDIVVISASEVIPVDGKIVNGTGLIDQHVLTGEAQPAEKNIGDQVFASTVVLSGKIFLKVEQTGQQTVVAQIGKLLNQTAEYKTSLESSMERFVDRSVLPTLLLSGLAFPIAGTSGSLAVLISSVGYSLRVLAPLSTLNFLQIASKDHILIKDGSALETLVRVNTVVFDKTGTLTLDQPQVAKVHSWQGMDEDELLLYAAAAESRHTHPIARAIVAAAKEKGMHLPAVEDNCYEVGYGLKISLDNQRIFVGSNRFMRIENITIPKHVEAIQAECHNQGHSLVMVAVDDSLAGAIELKAVVRPEVKKVIQWLWQENISTVIISGDHAHPTQVLAEELGVDEYFAETLPQEKAAVISKMQSTGKTICFVGDGINDSIALKQADVSISLNGATSAAIDTAQVILMDKGLTALPQLFTLARHFNRNQNRNFLISVVPNIICIGGVFFFHFGFYAAIGLFNGSLMAGIGNAMQPLFLQNNAHDVKGLERAQL